MAATTWVPMDFRVDSSAECWGEFRAGGLGAMQVVVIDLLPITVLRTPKLISLADPDLLKMVLVCGGNSCVVEQDHRQARLSADRAMAAVRQVARHVRPKTYAAGQGW